MVRVEKMLLLLKGTDFNNGVGEVQPGNENSIKSTESTHNDLIRQHHSLSGSKFNYAFLDDTKWHLPQSSSKKAVSQGDASEAVRVLLDCPRELAKGRNK